MAVLTYLRRILESVDHPDMINLILHYLLALPDIVSSRPSDSGDVVSAARKRKSLDLATMVATQGEATADPLLFNLVDLILACLRSQSQQTILVTLQLVSVILKRHHRYAVSTLLYTDGVLGDSTYRTSGAHHQEVEFFMNLAGTVGGQDNFDEIYDNVLKDTLTRLENHPCSVKLVTPKTSINNHKLPAIPDSLPGAPRDVRSHTLRPEDPLLNIILDRLETFFINPVETNLSLTEALFDLAACGYMHLEGWFLRHPQNYVYDDDDEPPLPEPPLEPESPEYMEHHQMQSLHECRRRPKWTQENLPRLLNILQSLCDQIAAFRETVPRFDDLLQQRREAFQIADSAVPAAAPAQAKNPNSLPSATASTTTLDRATVEESRNTSRERPSGLEGFAQRILSEFGTPSRSGSPRGRKESHRSVSDRSTPVPLGGRDGSGTLEAPIRGATPSGLGARSYSPSSSSSQQPPWENKLDTVVTQAKAFEAIDQSILARQVSLPIRTKAPDSPNEPIPLNFEKDTPTEIANDDDPTQERAHAPHDGQDESFMEDSKTDTSVLTPVEEKTVSVSHVLTNAIVLQSFLFELASLVQVRAGLFDEVRFT